MDTLLNAPILLVLLVALVGIVLLISGLRAGRREFQWAGYAVLVLALLLELAALFVPTDSKTVERKARDLMAAISAGNWTAVDPMFKHATMYNWQGSELTRAAHDAADRYGLTDVRVNGMTVHKEPLAITVRISVTTHHKEQYVDSVPSTWDFQYQKRPPEGWVLIQVTPIQIGNVNGSAEKESIVRGHIRY